MFVRTTQLKLWCIGVGWLRLRRLKARSNVLNGPTSCWVPSGRREGLVWQEMRLDYRSAFLHILFPDQLSLLIVVRHQILRRTEIGNDWKKKGTKGGFSLSVAGASRPFRPSGAASSAPPYLDVRSKQNVAPGGWHKARIARPTFLFDRGQLMLRLSGRHAPLGLWAPSVPRRVCDGVTEWEGSRWGKELGAGGRRGCTARLHRCCDELTMPGKDVQRWANGTASTKAHG
jgi:hypothetical protein